MSEDNEFWKKKKYILETIRKEASSRPLVPFLGAGISVSAGFPTINFLIQYLAKVDFAIQYGVFADRFPDIKTNHQTAVKTYQHHPSKYLEDFGWPSLGQLNADIWDWLERGHEDNNDFYGVGREKIWEKSRLKAEDKIKELNHYGLKVHRLFKND